MPEAPAPPQQKTGNAQQCRRYKALMRHTAAGCFPSTRCCWRGSLLQTQENPGAEGTGVEILVAVRSPSPKPQTVNAQQCRRLKALMRHTAARCFPCPQRSRPSRATLFHRQLHLNRSRRPNLASRNSGKARGGQDGVEILVIYGISSRIPPIAGCTLWWPFGCSSHSCFSSPNRLTRAIGYSHEPR